MERRLVRSKIFICYSHKDAGDLEQIQRFLLPLEQRGLIDLWDDTRLLAGDHRAAGIGRGLAEAAVAVLLITQNFVASKSITEQQMPRILEAKDQGELRVIPVFMRPSTIDMVEHAFVTRFKGFGEPQRVLMRLDKSAREEVFVRLAVELEALTEATPSAERTHSGQVTGTVFLADVADTLRQQKRRLAKDLKPYGIEVVRPYIPPPFEQKEHDRQTIKALGRADLSVHLLDAVAGREAGDRDDEETYPQRQVALARGHARAQLIWVPRELDLESVDDQSHRAFLRRLKHGEGVEQSYDYVCGVRADMARQIVEKVKERKSAATTAEEGVAPGASAPLLVTHKKDTPLLLRVAAALLGEGIEPYIFQEVDEPQTVFRLFKKRVRSVDRLIIFYNEVSSGWVEKRLEMANKVAVSERPSLRLSVYAPDKSSEEASFSRESIQVETLTTEGEALAFVGNAS